MGKWVGDLGKWVAGYKLSMRKGDIRMSSADPPDRLDLSAGAANLHQPCSEIFLSLACDHDGDEHPSWSRDIKFILDTSNLC